MALHQQLLTLTCSALSRPASTSPWSGQCHRTPAICCQASSVVRACAPVSGHELQKNHDYPYYRCPHPAPRTNRPRLCDARSIRVSLLEPRAWDEGCKVIEDPETLLNELRARQGRTTALDEEIERIQATVKTLDAQKQRAMRLFTIAEASDADVKRELARINKLHLQARSRLAELEGRRAVSAQFEPMAAKVTLYCELMRDRLNDLSFEQKREVLDALQAQFTLDKEGEGELR